MKKFNSYYWWFVLITIIYLSLIFLLPPDASVLTKYGITSSQAKLLSLSLAIPILIIWFLGFFGFIRFKQYAQTIGKNRDGTALKDIANGLMVLVIGQQITTLANQYLNYEATVHASWRPAMTIITNYLALLAILPAFYLIYRGAQYLQGLAKQPHASRSETIALTLFVIFSLLYIYFTLINPARQFPTAQAPRAAYYLADPLLLLTIIVPYLFVWYYGIRAAVQINEYKANVKGVLYKQALGYLAAGLGTVMVLYMFIRLLTSFTTQLNSWSLKVLLSVLYLLVLGIGIGYGLIAVGAKKLQKIEEV